MGIYFNPKPDAFLLARNTNPYIDKSMLIDRLNEFIDTERRFICVSRPRRFGKTMATNMIAAYYAENTDANALFESLKIMRSDSFKRYCNKYIVLKINMQEFVSRDRAIDDVIKRLNSRLSSELTRLFDDITFYEDGDIIECMKQLNDERDRRFVVIIDEWDCIFREYPDDHLAQRKYLDFLRDFLKDRAYIALAYMTGILPIKKYGTESALNMFQEISMENPGNMAEFTGFTEDEVREICASLNADFEECRTWYDGYSFLKTKHVFNPNSVVTAATTGVYDDYWNKTETYKALQNYIDLNFVGLRDSIIKMMAGDRQKINTGSFQNDMTSFGVADDVLTLLIHLGYLGYDFATKEVFIPNKEIMQEFITATTSNNGWREVINSVNESETLLSSTWNGKENEVATGIEKAHLETSHLQYNDENALSYTISLAYYAAREYYNVVRELPTGKGFADLCFIPKQRYIDKTAMIVELKWNKSAETAINQIRERQYPASLKDYAGNILLVGINYDKETKKHTCRIEKA